MDDLDAKLIELDNNFSGGHEDDPLHKYKVHRILAHSYFLYFFSFLAGVLLDLVFKIKIVSSEVLAPLGALMLILATALIFWAQYTSRTMHRDGVTKETFYRGPYAYTRSPTHLGLYMLLLGFGFISNGLFVVILTTVASLVTKFVFLRQEEKELEARYGAHYAEYKKSVKL